MFDSFASADNINGVQLFHLEGVRVSNLRVVGLSANYGNPWSCDEPDGGGCAPVAGCK